MDIYNQQFPFPHLQWNNKRFIAGGSFSKVYKVKNSVNNNYYAVKEFNMKNNNPEQNLSMVQNQIFIMNTIDSPYVVHLIDYSIGQNFSYIIMEFCQGDLKNLISHHRSKIPEKECVKYLYDIVLGLLTLHQSSYIHRDLKPANVLVKEGKCKLTDFSFTTISKDIQNQYFNDSCGTPLYMSPQILNNEPFSSKCDIWSLGILFYEMIYGYPPWPMKKIEVYKSLILKQKVIFPFGKKVSQETKNFIRKCLTVKQRDRIGWSQLLNHQIFKQIHGKRKSTQQQKQLSDQQKIINPILKWMLSNIKKQVKNQQININGIFQKYQKFQSFDFKEFSVVLRQINPSITTHECDFLFKILDKDNSSLIQRKQFEVMFAEVNFKQCNIIINRQINSIIAIIQANKICLNNLFNKIDKNKNGKLDKNQFLQFLGYILPHLQKDEKVQIFKDFDIDNSGCISKEEFFKHLGYAIVKGYTQQDLAKARGLRNLLNMKKYMNCMGLKTNEIMSRFDLNKNRKIEGIQMMNMLKKINYAISGQQVMQIFRMMDKDNSGGLDYEQLQQFFQSKL